MSSNPSSSTGANQQPAGASESFYHPFSKAALQLLPKRRNETVSKRNDRIPDTQNASGITPLVRDYHSISNAEGVQIRVPKKVATPVRVEAKVWFANERTWISYLSVGVLIASLSLAMYNASNDGLTTWFAYAYALISIAVIVYGFLVYQQRLTMISARDASQFEKLWGPLLISGAIFIAILANFIFRVVEFKKRSEDGRLLSIYGF